MKENKCLNFFKTDRNYSTGIYISNENIFLNNLFD